MVGEASYVAPGLVPKLKQRVRIAMNKPLLSCLIAGLLVLATNSISADDATDAADSVFEPPVCLTADGEIIETGKAWGHSSPCVADLEGDGLDDLIVGDFSGKFHVYRNVGSATQPKYKEDGLLQAGGVDAEVRIYCCIGCQARMGDLDGDGILDMISNSYDPGHCYLFRGLPDHKFAAREELLDKAGVPVRSAPHQEKEYESFGSFYELVDWDNDGLWDIIAGSEDGSVTFFRNVGEITSPVFASGQVLVPRHECNGYNMAIWSDPEIAPGIRSQVDITDFNGDGQLDLVLGDFYTAFDFKKNVSAEETDEIEKRLADYESQARVVGKKIEALRNDLKKRFPGDKMYSDEAVQSWQEESTMIREGTEAKQVEALEKEIVQEIRPYLASTDGDGDEMFYLARAHGHVWVYLRKSQKDAEPVAVKFESSNQTVHAGNAIDITVKFKMAPGYEIHAFEKKPLATATRLKLDLPRGFSGARQWEEPPITGFGSLPGGVGYQGNVTFYNEIRVADGVDPGDYELTCSVAYQACNSHQCLRPVESKLKIKVSVKP